MTTRSGRPVLCFALTASLCASACSDEQRTPPGATFAIGDLLGGADTLHARATGPQPFTFPADHGPHPEFRTEWWYFTGSLTAERGRELGYQLTIFRSALTDSASFLNAVGVERSSWRTRHAYMAHLAVTDAADAHFYSAEKFARGAAGLAGAHAAPLRVWLDDWSVESVPAATTFPVRLKARADDFALDLVLHQGKPIVLQGDRGLSRKGAERGNASYYYSLTRMPTGGTIRTPAGTHAVTGTSWLDREWSTSVLPPGVDGWDWLSLQLDDSTELMLYRLRRADGTVDPFSAATFIAADGTARGFGADEFGMNPVRMWRAADGVEYPVAWSVAVPALALTVSVRAALDDQELNHAVRYWEGMVRARGTHAGRPISARGYLEMTGYAGAQDSTR
jgi:predicted secreted hydrolase